MTTSGDKSRSRIIPGEGETAFQRWELPHLMTAQQVEHIQKQAYEEGFASGQAEGLRRAEQETRARIDVLDQIIGTLNKPLKELDESVEQELLLLTLAAARLIVRREIKADPGRVIAAVREALGALPAAARHVRLHLHPVDAVLVREHLKPAEEEHSWKIVEDPALGRGGCLVQTDTSQIDASVDARLTAILATMLGGERSDDKRS